MLNDSGKNRFQRECRIAEILAKNFGLEKRADLNVKSSESADGLTLKKITHKRGMK